MLKLRIINTMQQLKAANSKFNNKIKGTFIEKGKIYLQNVARDYKEVVISVKQEIKEKPVKSTFMFTGLGFLWICLKNNPNKQSFEAKYLQCANDVSLVHSNVVNPTIRDHLKYIRQCYNKDLIRHTSFGLFSVIWVDKYSEECNIYETNCSYLKVGYSNFVKHIIDVGLLNIWWVISRKMLDYDINY